MATTLSTALLNFPSDAFILTPLPLAPGTSMKYSAATSLVLPVLASLANAVILGAVLVGLEVAVTAEVTGPIRAGVTFAVVVVLVFISV